MLWLFTRRKEPSAEQLQRTRRKCGALHKAWSTCLKANKEDTNACQYLEASLVSCYSEICCPAEATAHARCYKRAIVKGQYEGLRTCEMHFLKMKECLKIHGLYPIQE